MNRPWMPLYVNDFLVDTLDLEADEIGVYAVLLMLAWRRDDAAIPDDMNWLKRSLQASIANFHGRTFNRIVPKILGRYFVLLEGKYTNKRLTKEREKVQKFSEKQKENVEKRWAKTKENSELADTNVLPARALHSHSHSHSQSKKKETREAALLFDVFWQSYPHKTAKVAAVRAFHAALKRGALPSDILRGLENYIRDKPPDRNWMNPSTFLNQNRWEDQPAKVENGKVSSISSACDNLVQLVSAGFGRAAPQDGSRSPEDEIDARLLSYGGS